MIELLPGFPDDVVAVTAKGHVSRRDYAETLVPAIEAALQRHEKLRLYYEIGPALAGFDAGAMWEDFKVGMGHWSRWGRVAVVTDIDWIRHAVNAFRFMMPEEARVFATAEAAQARAWLLG